VARLVWHAIYALQRAGLDSQDRLRRALEREEQGIHGLDNPHCTNPRPDLCLLHFKGAGEGAEGVQRMT